MKYLFFYNLLLVFVLFYTFFLTKSDVKMHYLSDVSNIQFIDAMDKLKDYEVAISYVFSDKEEGTVLYTKPKAFDLVYDKELITLYVSSGSLKERYQDLTGKLYKDVENYLSDLIVKYELDVKINYITDESLIDGVIKNINLVDEFIDFNDKIQLSINNNPKEVFLPDFTGWYIDDVIKYANTNKINIEFVYITLLYPKDFVISQSVKGNAFVVKNSMPILIYLSKEF